MNRMHNKQQTTRNITPLHTPCGDTLISHCSSIIYIYIYIYIYIHILHIHTHYLCSIIMYMYDTLYFAHKHRLPCIIPTNKIKRIPAHHKIEYKAWRWDSLGFVDTLHMNVAVTVNFKNIPSHAQNLKHKLVLTKRAPYTI